jgi:hypothetical protein
MSELQHPHLSGESLQGREFTPDTFDALAAAMEEVFDYRGDVTLRLRDGRTLAGYVFNRELQGSASFCDLMPQSAPEKLRIAYADIAAVAFSGKDMASGRSWEAWIAKWNAKKAALAEGRDIGNIEPKATHLDQD